MSDPTGSPSTLYAFVSAVFGALQSIVYFAIPGPLLSILEPLANDQVPSTALCWVVRIAGLLLLGLAYPQFQLASRALDADDAEHFYAWTLSLASQIVLFVVAYVRYSAARVLAPPLGFEGGVTWLALMVASGGLAAWGIWCLLFVDDKAGHGQGKVRSSGWLFPSKDKRKAKIEKRERKYGKMAME